MIPHAQEVGALIDADQAIPEDEMPDTDARAALLAAIRSGRVIGVYQPFGSTRHNIEVAGPRDVDPRLSCAEWAARAQKSQHGERGGQSR